MLGLIVIVLIFVGTGITVVALAMRSGRKPDPKATKRSQPTVMAGVALVTVAFGLGIPAFVIAYNNGSQSKEAVGGISLTADEQEGRIVFAEKCATCHQLGAANAVGRVGPDLDRIIPPIAEEKARIAFINDAITNGRARGDGQMPAGLVDGEDQERVTAFIAKTAGR
ncbi:MAG: cytochrome c [Solirubrobacterales bacterium]|nr:cytochrome c [Solirubrobacterales bacterium]